MANNRLVLLSAITFVATLVAMEVSAMAGVTNPQDSFDAEANWKVDDCDYDKLKNLPYGHGLFGFCVDNIKRVLMPVLIPEAMTTSTLGRAMDLVRLLKEKSPKVWSHEEILNDLAKKLYEAYNEHFAKIKE